MTIPPEAMAEIRKQCRIHGFEFESVNGIVFAEGFRAGRASIHAQWAATLAQDPPPADEHETLHARAQAIAREMVEHDIRAEVAAQIRTELLLASCSGPCFRDRCDCRAGDVVERAARIAEGSTPMKQEARDA